MNDFFLDAISKLSKAKREMMSTIVSKKEKWNIVALIVNQFIAHGLQHLSIRIAALLQTIEIIE